MKDGVKTGARPMAQDMPPDPFEDIAAPSLRLTPRPERPKGVSFPTVAKAAPILSEAPEPEFGPESEPQAQADGALPKAIRALPHHGGASGSRGEIVLALVVGLALAAAIVAGALFLRPTPVATPTALGSGPTPAEPGLQVAATPVSDVTVRLRLPAGVDAARTGALRDALAAAGFVRVEIATPGQPIGTPRVEYAHPEDRAAAETLAAALAPLAGADLAAAGPADEAGSGPIGHIVLWMGQ